MKTDKTASEIVHEALIRIKKEKSEIPPEELKKKRFEHFCSMPGEYEIKKLSRFS